MLVINHYLTGAEDWRRLRCSLEQLGTWGTSAGGQPLVAAELWARRHPISPRATHFLATSYLAVGNANTARQVLERAAYANPTTVGLALQALLLTCKNGDADATWALYRLASEHATQGQYSAATVNSLTCLRERRKGVRSCLLPPLDRLPRPLPGLPAMANATVHHLFASLERNAR